MRVKTFGGSSARSASTSTMTSSIGWRPFFRISTTSQAEQLPAPISTSSIAEGPGLGLSPSAVPMTMEWPDSVCPVKVLSATQAMRDFMVLPLTLRAALAGHGAEFQHPETTNPRAMPRGSSLGRLTPPQRHQSLRAYLRAAPFSARASGPGGSPPPFDARAFRAASRNAAEASFRGTRL